MRAMIEPIGASAALNGFRMIWTGVRWILRSKQAPWNVISMSASLEPYMLLCYSVRFFCPSEKPFAIELLTARIIQRNSVA